MNNHKILIRIIIISLGIIFYSHLILVLYYTIWISKSIVIAYNICLYSLTFCYFFIILLEVPCIGNKIIYSINETCLSTFLSIYFILIISEITILGLNLYDFSNYWANCPFTINEPYSNYHYKRRCELYGINSNSRYRYQYICSYNSFKDFGYLYIVLYKKYKPYYFVEKNYQILCVQFKSVLLNNKIVDLFNKEYLKENKYYCGRIELPTKNIFVEDRNCNNNLKKNFFYLLYIICILQILYALSHYHFKLNELEKANNLNLRRSQNDIQNSNNNNEQSRSSTNISDNNNNININFKRLNTRNIIYINKKEITINQDINNISIDKSNQDINNISLDKSNQNINNINILNNEYIYKLRKENNT